MIEAFISRFERAMFDRFPLEKMKIEDAHYFIEPSKSYFILNLCSVNLDARFTYLTKIEKNRPMYSMDIVFHERNVILSKDQYSVMIKLADFIKAYSVYLDNR